MKLKRNKGIFKTACETETKQRNIKQPVKLKRNNEIFKIASRLIHVTTEQRRKYTTWVVIQNAL